MGMAPIHDVPEAPLRVFQQWASSPMRADMDYLVNFIEERKNPGHANIHPNARILISIAFAYHEGAVGGGAWDNVACHARARDYHKTIKQKLLRIIPHIQMEFPDAAYRILVDSAPIMERSWAVLAGVGTIGRNGMLIVPHVGPKVLLGEILLSQVPHISPNPSPTAPFSVCAGCNLCVVACPTGALNGDGLVNARRCISYLSIEAGRAESGTRHATPNSNERSDFFLIQKGNSFFGCDSCTEVCPLVEKIPCSLEAPVHRHLAKDLIEISTMPEAELQNRLQGTSLHRTGAATIKRNAKMLLQSVDAEAHIGVENK